METRNLFISDETLRDGEQQVGLFIDDKAALARLIAQTGVHQIAMMPAIHPHDAQLTTDLATANIGPIAASTMMRRTAIDQSKACGVSEVILFHAVSDRLLFLRDGAIAADPSFIGKTIDDGIPTRVIQAMQQRMIVNVLEHVRYAVSQGLRVCFAAEDASRADFHFLLDCIHALAPYVDQVLLCDTVGILTPEKTFVWIHDIVQDSTVPISVHFHNDMGLALENTIQAVVAGAQGVSGTFGGIGERAGNVALEQLLRGLRVRFGWEVAGINYDAIDQVTHYLHTHNLRPHPPYSAAAQRHESGIHVSALLCDRQSYAPLAYGEPEIWFGKCSGASNLQYLFEQHLKQPLTQAQYEQLREVVKAIALKEKRSFSADEMAALLQTDLTA